MKFRFFNIKRTHVRTQFHLVLNDDLTDEWYASFLKIDYSLQAFRLCNVVCKV